MKLYRIDRTRTTEHALVYRRTPDTTAHTHDPQETLKRLLDAKMLFEVEPVDVSIVCDGCGGLGNKIVENTYVACRVCEGAGSRLVRVVVVEETK